MNGELSLGKVKNISILKTNSTIDGRNDYDITFQTESGYFHLTHINELPYFLLRAISNMRDWEEEQAKLRAVNLNIGGEADEK